MKAQQQKLCWYFIEGRCKFGSNCRNSHNVIQCYLLRHAQSQFNLIANESQHEMYSQQAKKLYHVDVNLIDCGVTKKGLQPLRKRLLNFPPQLKVDAIFVSPLKRSLITAEQLIKAYNIKCKKIIVLPDLTEVVSKICDFSDSIQDKVKKFANFDFSQFEKYKQNLNSWQDELIDECYHKQIDAKESYGRRYIKILQSIFPTPLECSHSCFKRVLSVVNLIKNICMQKHYKKIIVVSHNRILKYFSGKDNKGRAQSFDNCQIRVTYI